MSEATPQLPEGLNDYNHLDAQVTSNGHRRVYGVDAVGKKTLLKGDDVLDAYGYDDLATELARADAAGTPVDVDDPAAGDNPYEKLGEVMRDVAKPHVDKKMLHAYAAAEDFRKGHDRAENPHIDDMSAEEKVLFSLSSNKKQKHADRIAGDGAYDTELERLKTGVREKIDDEHYGDSLAFWSGEDVTEGAGNGDGGEDEPGDAPEALTSPELQEAEAQLAEARTALAQIRAGREARSWTRRFSDKKLQAALEAYEEALGNASSHAVTVLREADWSGEEITLLSNHAAVAEAIAVINEQTAIERENFENKSSLNRRFIDFWQRNSGHKLLSKAGIMSAAKKGVVLGAVAAPLGFVGGMVAAPLAGAGLGVAGGIAVAGRVSRGLMGARLTRDGQNRELVDDKAEQRQRRFVQTANEMIAAGRGLAPSEITARHGQDTKESVSRNRHGMVKSAIASAVMGGLFGAVGSNVDINTPSWMHRPDWLGGDNSGDGSGSDTPENGDGGPRGDAPTTGDIPDDKSKLGFPEMDSNTDGFVTEEEYMNYYDADSDGVISETELKSAMNPYELEYFENMSAEDQAKFVELFSDYDQFQQFAEYLEGAEEFKAENPTITVDGKTASLEDQPEAYDRLMHRLMDQFFAQVAEDNEEELATAARDAARNIF